MSTGSQWREEHKEMQKDRTKRKNEVLEDARRECAELQRSKIDAEVAIHLAWKVTLLEGKFQKQEKTKKDDLEENQKVQKKLKAKVDQLQEQVDKMNKELGR